MPRSGPKGSPSHPDPPHPRKTRGWLGLLGLASLVLALIFYGIDRYQSRSPVTIPIPADLDALEPQLRAYLLEKLEWVREKPRRAERHATLGMIYAVNLLWPEARLAFENALRLNPDEPLAHLYAAIATHELGQSAEALERFRQVTERFPHFPQAYYRLGSALLRSGQLDQAHEAFQRLEALAPGEWRAHAGMGEIHFQKGDPDTAIQHLEKALAFDPLAKPAHHLLGLCYRAAGRTNEAELELSLGLNAIHYPMPDAWAESASVHMKLLQDQYEQAEAFAAMGQPQKAVELLEQARPYHPDNVSLLNNLALAYARAGLPQQGRDLALLVLQKDPENLSAHMTLSNVSLDLGRFDLALHYADQALRISPSTPHGYLSRGNAFLAAGRDQEAYGALQEAFQRDPQNALLLMEIGDIAWRNLQRSGEALGHYRRVVQLNPSMSSAHVRLADLALQLGDVQAARRSVDYLRKLTPASPELEILERRLKRLDP